MRREVAAAVLLLLFIAALAAYPWLGLLPAAAAFLIPGWTEPIWELLYGPALAPRFALVQEGRTAYVSARGLTWRFYEAHPRLSIDVHREDAVRAASAMIAALPLSAGYEFLFARAAGRLVVGIGVPRGGRADLAFSVLNRYFLLEPAPPEVVRAVAGRPRPLNPLPAVIPLVLLALGLGRGPGLIAGAVLAAAAWRDSRLYAYARTALPATGVRASSAMYMELSPSSLLPAAEQNAGKDFALALSRPVKSLEEVRADLARAIDRYAVTGRGKYAPRIEEYAVAHRRILAGEAAVRYSVLGDLVLPGMRMGRGRHWLFGGFIDGLSMDVAAVPIFYGGSLIAGDDPAVLDVGRDEYGASVKIGLNTAPSPHALFVGPTGAGKTWTAASLLIRAIRTGVNAVVIDPHGEWCRYLSAFSPLCLRDAAVDWLTPALSATAWGDQVARAAAYAYKDPALGAVVYEDLKEAYRGGGGFYEILQRLAAGGRARRLWEVAAENAPRAVHSPLDLMRRGVVVLDVSRLMAVPELLSLEMQLFIAKAYYEALSSGRRPEKVESLLVVDEGYFVIGSPALELAVRGVRKLGFGVWVITQTLGDVSYNTLQNFGFAVLLQGPAPYAEPVARAFHLGDEGIRWLAQANSPRVFGGEYSAGVLIYPPRPRRVYFKLEPVKG